MNIVEIERKMRPGAMADSGFLSPTQSLQDCINADSQTLSSLGITGKQITDRYNTLIEKAKYNTDRRSHKSNFFDYWKEVTDKGIPVENGRFKVSWVSYMGYQDCPYGCKGRDACSDTDYTITNNSTGQKIFFSQLHTHLINVHQFFEGDVEYRLDPAKAVEVLEIKKGVDYTPKFQSKEYWRQGSGCSDNYTKNPQDFVDNCFGDAKKIIKNGSAIPFGDKNKLGWATPSALYIAYVGESYSDESVLIDGMPIYEFRNGAYVYTKYTHKWIEDKD